jgi:hypothetical protein
MTNDDRKKSFFSLLFRPKVFYLDFPQKVFFGVFELVLLLVKKFTKNAIKKRLKKRHLPTPFSGHLPDIRRFQQKKNSVAP